LLKKTLLSTILILTLVFGITACQPTDEQIRLAILETQMAIPTATATPQPTDPPLPTATATPATIPGIDIPVYILGVDLQFYVIQQLDYVNLPDGTTQYPNPGDAFYAVAAKTFGGTAKSVANWPTTGENAVRIILTNGDSYFSGGYGLFPDATNPNIVDWVFVIPEDATIQSIFLPGGVIVDLSSISVKPSGPSA
jgi:hypothetical protein